jgi:nitrite reductase/ring-hydroxylating ferredoxin subunit
MSDFIRVAATNEIPKGEGRVFEVGGKEVAVFNCNGTFYAIDNVCKHQGGPLGEGDLEGTVVTCPWHGWTYDVTSGISPDDDECHVAKYEVRVDGSDVLVAV